MTNITELQRNRKEKKGKLKQAFGMFGRPQIRPGKSMEELYTIISAL